MQDHVNARPRHYLIETKDETARNQRSFLCHVAILIKLYSRAESFRFQKCPATFGCFGAGTNPNSGNLGNEKGI